MMEKSGSLVLYLDARKTTESGDERVLLQVNKFTATSRFLRKSSDKDGSSWYDCCMRAIEALVACLLIDGWVVTKPAK
jgi:hypothetical protein